MLHVCLPDSVGPVFRSVRRRQEIVESRVSMKRWVGLPDEDSPDSDEEPAELSAHYASEISRLSLRFVQG